MAILRFAVLGLKFEEKKVACESVGYKVLAFSARQNRKTSQTLGESI